jgi:hypothetical protein
MNHPGVLCLLSIAFMEQWDVIASIAYGLVVVGIPFITFLYRGTDSMQIATRRICTASSRHTESTGTSSEETGS